MVKSNLEEKNQIDDMHDIEDVDTCQKKKLDPWKKP